MLWLPLPFTLGVGVADAMASSESTLALSGLLWAGWAVVVVAALVPSAVSLTTVRVLAPVAFALALWSAYTAPASLATALGITLAAAVTIVALSAITGDTFVNGSSYGSERRFALRTPGALVLGPVPVTWLLTVGVIPAGAVIFASGRWVVGGVVMALGAPTTWLGVRRLHRLSQRWVVFVPAGFVLHDRMAMSEALLVPRMLIEHLGPAPANDGREHPAATDLTLGARGLVLRVDLREPTSIVFGRARGGPKEPTTDGVAVEAVLFSACRPGAVMIEAEARRLTAQARRPDVS